MHHWRASLVRFAEGAIATGSTRNRLLKSMKITGLFNWIFHNEISFSNDKSA